MIFLKCIESNIETDKSKRRDFLSLSHVLSDLNVRVQFLRSATFIFYAKFLNLVLKHRASSYVEGTELNLVFKFSSFHFYPNAILFLSGLKL